MADKALEDLKVVELADFISGPCCTKMLADLGAEVIKVERPQVGDISRRLGPFPGDVPHPEKSGLFIYLNTNKLGITLNIETPKGQKILKELLKNADVFIESYPRKMMEKLKLDYKSLKKINPQLVMTSITPWGHTGPYRDYKGYDINISAAGALSCRLGSPDREPLVMPAYQTSYYAAVTAAAATMLAVYARSAGHAGQHVDISQVRCWATSYSLTVTRFLTQQNVGMRTGRVQPGFFPYAILPVKDGAVLMIAITEDEWQLILDMMGKPEWANDPRFQTMYSRYEHREELMSLMKPWLMSHTRADILNLGMEMGAFKCCVPLQVVGDMINSQHLKERNFFAEIEHPGAGKLKFSGPLARLTETPWAIRRRAPFLGEHNEEIYSNWLGYTKQDLVRLRASGVV